MKKNILKDIIKICLLATVIFNLPVIIGINIIASLGLEFNLLISLPISIELGIILGGIHHYFVQKNNTKSNCKKITSFNLNRTFKDKETVPKKELNSMIMKETIHKIDDSKEFSYNYVFNPSYKDTTVTPIKNNPKRKYKKM